MNRDELLSRAPERPPKRHGTDHGASWLAPTDGEKGGTWMGANDGGVVACLLNAYLPGESLLPDTSGRFRTRGEIIAGVLSKGPAADGLTWLLEEFDPVDYQSFTLLLIAPRTAKCVTWLGRDRLTVETLDGEWTIRSSSGWDSAETARWREIRFDAWRAAGCPMIGTLPTFHVLREPGEEEKSPLMRREWSNTRSITQAVVDLLGGAVVMKYWPNPTPDSAFPAKTVQLSFAESGPPLPMGAP